MKKLLFAILLSLTSFAVGAQNAIEVEVPGVVAVDEQFNLTFVVSGENKPKEFEWNCSDDFKLVWGPQTGSSTSLSIVNGVRTKSSQTTYTYLLIAKKEGEFSLPKAVAKVGSKQIASTSPTIRVVRGSSQVGQQGEDIFLTMEFSRKSAYVGEPITATLKLYTNVNLAGFEDLKFPEFDGFWSQETYSPQNLEFNRDTYNGAIYNVAVLRRYSLIPQKVGRIPAGGSEMICLVNVRNRNVTSGSVFDAFFQNEYTTVRKRIHTDDVEIDVRPLPQPSPASFGGGVGQYSIRASVTRDSLSTHEASSLLVVVKGTGNLTMLDAPKVNFPSDFEVYDPKVTDNGGERCFEYPFIPRSHGNFILESIPYSFFNPGTGSYTELSTPEFAITVTKNGKAVESSEPQVIHSYTGKQVKSLASDIRYIHTREGGAVRASALFVSTPLYAALLVVMALLSVAAYVILARRARIRGDEALYRRKSAVKLARRRLANVRSYEDLQKAALGFVADRLGITHSDLSKDNIKEKLIGSGVDGAVADRYVGLLDKCDYARYAPSASQESMSRDYEEAVSLISQLSEVMKKKPGKAGAVIVAAVLMVLPAASAFAQEESLWQQGVQAYEAQDWDTAAECFRSLIPSDGTMAGTDVYYNLGNVCFKQDDIASAVLYYSRALKADPSNSDAAFNLEYVQGMLQDRIESVPEVFVTRWIHSLRDSMSSNAWAVLSLLLFAVLCAFTLVCLLGKGRARKAGFVISLVSLVLCVSSLGLSLSAAKDAGSSDRAVVVSPVSTVRSSPGSQGSKELFVLHEGTTVGLIETVGQWQNIELSDGRRGWIKISEIEVI